MTPSGFKLGPSSTLRFSDDGTYLVTLRERTARLWRVLDRRPIASGPRFSHASSADFSPDGTLLAVKNTTGDVLVLSVPDLDEVSRLSGRELGEGTPIRFADDGKYIVDGNWGGALMVRDPISGALAWSSGAKASSVSNVLKTERSGPTTATGCMCADGRLTRTSLNPSASGALRSRSRSLTTVRRVAGISAGLEVSEQHVDGIWSASHRAFPARWDGAAHGLCWGPGDELIHAHHSTCASSETSGARLI